MSLATFDDTMKFLTVEYDDREVYNDIRSEIDLTVTDVVLDADAVYGQDVAITGAKQVIGVGSSITATITVYATDRLPVIEWLDYSAVGYYTTGVYSGGAVPAGYFVINIGGTSYLALEVVMQVGLSSSDNKSINLSLTNVSGQTLAEYTARATYKYLASDVVTHEETGIRTITIRETDDASILAYGRRVLNLTWPLGQTENQTLALAQAYLARYKDPVPRLRMTVYGKTDALIEQIFTRKISDLITVQNTTLGLNADFYINNINLYHDPYGLPIAEWTLEYQRTIEAATLFTIDTSEIDGLHVIAY